MFVNVINNGFCSGAYLTEAVITWSRNTYKYMRFNIRKFNLKKKKENSKQLQGCLILQFFLSDRQWAFCCVLVE